MQPKDCLNKLKACLYKLTSSELEAVFRKKIDLSLGDDCDHISKASAYLDQLPDEQMIDQHLALKDFLKGCYYACYTHENIPGKKKYGEILCFLDNFDAETLNNTANDLMFEGNHELAILFLETAIARI